MGRFRVGGCGDRTRSVDGAARGYVWCFFFGGCSVGGVDHCAGGDGNGSVGRRPVPLGIWARAGDGDGQGAGLSPCSRARVALSTAFCRVWRVDGCGTDIRDPTPAMIHQRSSRRRQGVRRAPPAMSHRRSLPRRRGAPRAPPPAPPAPSLMQKPSTRPRRRRSGVVFRSPPTVPPLRDIGNPPHRTPHRRSLQRAVERLQVWQWVWASPHPRRVSPRTPSHPPSP